MSETQSPPLSAKCGWLPVALQSQHSSDALMYELFEGNPDSVFIVDERQRIVAANSRALKEFSYTDEVLIGQPVSVLLPEAARERHAGHVRSFLAHPSVRSVGSGIDLKGCDAHGNEFPVDVMLRPMVASCGQYVVAVCRRPDEALARSQMQVHALIERSLEQAAAELETRVEQRTRQVECTLAELNSKNEEVEAFVYIVSHDLRAPLVNVQGFVRELEISCSRLKTVLSSLPLPEQDRQIIGEILEEDISGALRFISASSSKFERLIEALLGLSRQGRRIYCLEPIDVRELVDNAIAAMQQMIDDSSASIRIGPLPPVTADRTALDQVFSNLICNSIKYRSAARPLEVEVGGAIEDKMVHYWVRDNGLGIPESGKAKLFQVFQRLHPKMASGEGMGLAIVHRIVERHGGKIRAESEDREGTTFFFSLPA